MWPFTRKSNVVPISSHGKFAQHDEAYQLKARLSEAEREAKRLIALYNKFLKGLGEKRETVAKEEQWKRQVISMEHDASQRWYKFAEHLAEIERLGVELVATIEAQKKYNAEMKGKPEEYGPKAYAEALRQEIADLDREMAQAIAKQNPLQQQWWDSQVSAIKREQLAAKKKNKEEELREQLQAA